MRTIADALVYAVTYINLRGGDDGADDDGDIGALESIAAILRSASPEEEPKRTCNVDLTPAVVIGTFGGSPPENPI